MINTLIKTRKTVFTFAELQSTFSEKKIETLKQMLRRYKKEKKLKNPIKGIRTLPVYDDKELACNLKNNAYISLETVLYDFGAIFQAYFHTITCITNKTINYKFDGKEYRYSKIKNDILNNPICIKKYEKYSMAMPERALCDYLYLYPKAFLDNPEIFHNQNSLIRLKQILSSYPKKTKIHVAKALGLDINQLDK